jgi:hypothetical protein
LITYVNNKRKKSWSIVDGDVIEKVNGSTDPDEIDNVTYGNTEICKNICSLIEML